MRKNRKFYLPYLLTVIGTSAALYIMSAVCHDPGVADMPGRDYVTTMMMVGMVVASAFSAVLLFYTNSFLIKRRQKELGLYNILGMSKSNIARLMLCESVYVFIVGVGGGLFFGVLLHKFIMLVMCKIVRYSVPFGFYISFDSIRWTGVLFGCIILATLLFNLTRVGLSRPIELLRGGNTGEREPKTKWIIAILGILLLGGGYYIAMTVRTAVDALVYYFLAVALVIAGTYCLFVAVSIAVLKMLRRNKKFYYKTRNFIGVSGMLYRMKQNGVGLANICILSTMVMVMISGTLSLYTGTEEMLNNRYPGDIMTTVKYYPENGGYIDEDALVQTIEDKLTVAGGTLKKTVSHRFLSFAIGRKGDAGYFTTDFNEYLSADPLMAVFLTASDYAEYANTAVPDISGDEALIHTALLIPDEITLSMGDDAPPLKFTLKERLAQFPYISDYMAYIEETVYIVVPDDRIEEVYNAQRMRYGENASSMQCEVLVDLADRYALPDNIVETMYESDWTGVGSWESLRIETRAGGETDIYSMTGGFLFLGLFLGFIFIMATVLIIYYKQISEGYDDADRFAIMRKVGLSPSDIRRSVNSQILTVFFLPVIVAAIHIAFDFRLVVKLLSMFALNNISLMLACTGVTLLMFIVVYSVVFMITSRAYYKIVSGRE